MHFATTTIGLRIGDSPVRSICRIGWKSCASVVISFAQLLVICGLCVSSLIGAETITRDAVGRILQVDHGDGTLTTYSYDASGNRLNRDRIDNRRTIVVTVDPPNSGTITGDGPTFLNSTANLSASPAGGFLFAGWYEGNVLVNTDPILAFNVTTSRALTAKFTPILYSLTITANHGTVTRTPDLPSYPPGSFVIVSVSPSAGYIYTGVSGNLTTTASTFSITMDTNKTLTANFQPGLTATFNSATDTPLTTNGYSATGLILNAALNFAPPPGISLTVVNNTGLPFINGTFTNVAQGAVVPLSYGGKTYHFVANYFGGTGNDLMLVWKDNHLASWGSNASAQLGNGIPLGVSSPVAATTTGVLAGKSLAKISAGRFNAMALGSDGNLYGWGGNSSGQIGTGSSSQRTLPVATVMTGALAGKTISSLATGEAHTLVLTTDGSVYAWGSNSRGQLGDGTTSSRASPVAVNMSGPLAGKTILAIAAGADHSMALTSDGFVYAWGYNFYGQLGDGTNTQRTTPVAVNISGALAGKTVIMITGGWNHSLVGTSDGLLFGWGDNSQGQLGDGTSGNQRTAAVPVTMSGALSGKSITKIVGGGSHSLALDSAGKVYAWGYNNYGSVGDGTTTWRSTPVAVNTSGALSGKAIVAISAGRDHSAASDTDGKVYAWGRNHYGQLGDGTFNNRLAPVAVDASGVLAGKFIVGIACGDLDEAFTSVLASDGTVCSWGHNGYSQLGNGTLSNSTVPAGVASTPAMNGKTFVKVDGGGDSSVALTADGQVFSWGENYWGQLGDGSNLFKSSPVPVNIAGGTIIDVISGNIAAFALDSQGKLYAWGYNRGAFGNGTMNDSNVPVAVTASGVLSSKQIVAVAFMEYHVLALASDGVAYAWGDNTYGQLGDATTTARSSPVLVSTSGALAGKTVVAVAAGWTHSLALTSDGQLFAWGNNASGQLGTGTTGGTSSVPVAVNMSGALAGKTIVKITAGRHQSLAIDSNGQAYSWGALNLGRTGTTNEPLPLSTSSDLSGKTVFGAVAANFHVQTMSVDGKLFAWGTNTDGQIGDGSLTSRSVATAVQPNGVLPDNAVIAAGVGYYHNIAIVVGLPTPVLMVEQPTGTNLISGTSTMDYGGTDLGKSITRIVTVRNIGGTELTNLVVSAGGSNSGEFILTQPASTVLAPAGTSTFLVQFLPAAIGTRNATLHVASSDINATPFNLALTGSGNTGVESWRQQYFQTISNTGDASDDASPMHDGIPNFLKFATGRDPTKVGVNPGAAASVGNGMTFTYTRSKAAVSDGVLFFVEWTDTLAAGSWSTVGVTESTVDQGSTELVTANIPVGSGNQRFVRLRVSKN